MPFSISQLANIGKNKVAPPLFGTYPGTVEMSGSPSTQGDTTRQFPNNMGSYSAPGVTANSTQMYPNQSVGTMPTTFNQSNNGLKMLTEPQVQEQPVITTPPVNTNTQYVQDPSSLPSEQAPTPTPTDTSFDPLKAYRDLAMEQAMHSSQGTGLYSLKEGVPYTPEQIMAQRNKVDQLYGQALNEYANMAKEQSSKTPAYGADSDLAGLSTNSVNTIYKMSDAFNSHPIVKDFNIIQKSFIDANNLIKQSNENIKNGIKPTAAEDLQLIYMFAKAQDPNSVVREGEYNTVANYVSTLPQDIQSQISRVWEKQPTAKLTAEARNAILHGINRKYAADKQQYTQLRQDAVKHITGIAGKDVSSTFLNNYEGAESSDSNSSNSNDASFDWK